MIHHPINRRSQQNRNTNVCLFFFCRGATVGRQAAQLAEQEANRKPVYEDKPIVPRGWDSPTAEDTAREVRLV